MSTQQLTISEQKGVGLARMTDRRLEIFNDKEVRDNLTRTDLTITHAGTTPTIRELIKNDEKEFNKDFGTFCKFMARDLGVKGWADEKEMTYRVTRARDFILKYYDDFTMKEVKVAFELALIGELDEFLPKGKGGDPDKGHYQSFSVDFISKILNAMRKKKNATWAKAKNLLPQAEREVTDEEKRYYKFMLFKNILEAYDKFSETGEIEDFIAPFLIVNALKEIGIIDDVPEPNEENYARATMYFLGAKFIDKTERHRILNLKDGDPHPRMKGAAEKDVHKTLIKGAFQKLKSEKKHIKDFLPWMSK